MGKIFKFICAIRDPKECWPGKSGERIKSATHLLRFERSGERGAETVFGYSVIEKVEWRVRLMDHQHCSIISVTCLRSPAAGRSRIGRLSFANRLAIC